MTMGRSSPNLLQLAGRIALAAITGIAVGHAQSTSTNPATPVSRRLQGRVTNALDGAAVPRVLVQINGRTVLTDAQGRFEFPDFTDTQAFVVVTKPNYSQTDSNSPGNARQRIVNLDATIDLKIYPDATITGAVTGSDGLPLTHVSVSLKRGVFDQNGWRWIPTRPVQTDLHGEYRFREPAGRYQVMTGYVPKSIDTGEAVLPLQFPVNTSASTSNYFEVRTGQERRIDLRPRTGLTYPVPVKLDGTDEQRGIQFYAVTSGGETFQVQAPGMQGATQVSLPLGIYTLHARLENRDAIMEGATRVTVTGRQTNPAVIHLEPAAILPVELAIDPASTAASSSVNSLPAKVQSQSIQQPDLRQFNLHLHNLDPSGLPSTQDLTLRPSEEHGYEFRAPPGRYRLQAAGGGNWWVESATSGVTNLLSSDILISSGGSGTPIRIVASDVQGMVSATIRFPADTDTAYLYLIPSAATLSPVTPFTVPNPGTATATWSTRLPAGSYLAIALDHRVEADLHDPETLSRFSLAAQSVEVSSSGTAAIQLDIAQEKQP